MRNLLISKKNHLILAALAVGSLALSAAVAAQSGTSQKTAQNPPSGAASSKTRSSSAKRLSKSKKGTARKGKRVKGQAAPAPERINEIQAALAKRGFYSSDPTGKWDDATADSMRKFQAANGLNPTGKFDARTLQKLGLGSGTAGVAAPTPPPNSTNRLLSSKVQRDEVKNEPE